MMETLNELGNAKTQDPNNFDLTIATFLIGLGADNYVDLFRKRNISHQTLKELSDEDLIKIGVDQEQIRKKIIDEAKDLPNLCPIDQFSPLSLMEITDIFTESSKHFHRINLSILSNKIALKKNKDLYDHVLHYDQYASDVALKTIDELAKIIINVEKTLDSNLSLSYFNKERSRKKKLIVGSIGGMGMLLLTALLIRSLRQM